MSAVNNFCDVPSSRRVSRSMHDIYEDRFKNIQALLMDIPVMVSLKADGWSSKVVLECFVVTPHWTVAQ